VIGTFTSRALVYREGSMEKGGARGVDPAGGGGSVRGSLLGGNWKREDDGRENRTAMLLSAELQ